MILIQEPFFFAIMQIYMIFLNLSRLTETVLMSTMMSDKFAKVATEFPMGGIRMSKTYFFSTILWCTITESAEHKRPAYVNTKLSLNLCLHVIIT